MGPQLELVPKHVFSFFLVGKFCRFPTKLRQRFMSDHVVTCEGLKRFTCLVHGSKLFNETSRTDVWTIDFLYFFQHVSTLSWIYRDWNGTH